MDKTVIQHVHEREPIKVTVEEIATAEAKYEHKSDFANAGLISHIEQCTCIEQAAYTTTMVETIVNVFNHKDTRFFLVKSEGYEEPEWESEHLLKRDKCHDVIRSFWVRSGKRSTQEFYTDPEG